MAKKTQTSSFGVSEKVNHNSERFYNSKLYEDIKLNNIVEIANNRILNITNYEK